MPLPTLLYLACLGLPLDAGVTVADSTNVTEATAIELQSKDEKAFDRRWKKVDTSDVDELLELADWAVKKKIPHKAKKCWRAALKLEPQNDEANRGLGNVKVGDKWYTPEEAEKVKAGGGDGNPTGEKGFTEEKSSAGALVMPDEEGSKAKVDKALQANAGDSAALKARYIDELGCDETEYSVGTADHLIILGKMSESNLQQYAQIGEYCYRRLNWITFGKLEADVFKNFGGRHVYYLVDPEDFEGMVLFLQKEYPESVTRQSARYFLSKTNTGGFSFIGRKPFHIIKAGDRTSVISNGMGHHWLSCLTMRLSREVNIKTGKSEAGTRGRGSMMDWLKEGIGMWSAIDATGKNQFFRTTEAKYSNVGGVDKGKDGDMVAIAYEVAAGKYAGDMKPKSMFQLSRTQLRKLNAVDLAVSWSVIDYLIRGQTQKWREFVALGNRVSSFRTAIVKVFGDDAERANLEKALKSKNDRLLDTTYQKVIGEFEQGWKKWVLQNYREVYEDPSKTLWHPPFQPVQQGAGKKKEGDDKGDDPKKKRRRRRR